MQPISLNKKLDSGFFGMLRRFSGNIKVIIPRFLINWSRTDIYMNDATIFMNNNTPK